MQAVPFTVYAGGQSSGRSYQRKSGNAFADAFNASTDRQDFADQAQQIRDFLDRTRRPASSTNLGLLGIYTQANKKSYNREINQANRIYKTALNAIEAKRIERNRAENQYLRSKATLKSRLKNAREETLTVIAQKMLQADTDYEHDRDGLSRFNLWGRYRLARSHKKTVAKLQKQEKQIKAGKGAWFGWNKPTELVETERLLKEQLRTEKSVYEIDNAQRSIDIDAMVNDAHDICAAQKLTAKTAYDNRSEILKAARKDIRNYNAMHRKGREQASRLDRRAVAAGTAAGLSAATSQAAQATASMAREGMGKVSQAVRDRMTKHRQSRTSSNSYNP